MTKTGRHFRLDDEVYAAAQERAKREYTTVTYVVERALARYGGLMGDDGYDAPPSRAEPIEVIPLQPKATGMRKPASRPLGYTKEQQARGKR